MATRSPSTSSPWETLGDPPPREPARSTPTGPTDLAAVVAATTEAARHLGIAPIASPWLPPLPDLVVADTLEAPAWQVPYALADLPRQQVQRPVTWDLEHGGHLAVAGAGRTGRTSFLRTLGGTLAARFSPADVHLYGFDGSAGALQALTRLPHTGAVVHRDDAARCDRLVSRLLQEVRLRQLLLAQQGFGSVEEQRRAASAPRHAAAGAGEPPAGPPLPYLVLLLDSWQELATCWESVDHGRPVEALLRVLREGRAVGVRAVLTGDRSVLLSRVGSVVADRLVLRMADATDLLMAGISGDAIPSHQPAGRAVRVGDSRGDAAGPPRRRHRRTRAERGAGSHRPDRRVEAGQRGRARSGERAAPVPRRRPPDGRQPVAAARLALDSATRHAAPRPGG